MFDLNNTHQSIYVHIHTEQVRSGTATIQHTSTGGCLHLLSCNKLSSPLSSVSATGSNPGSGTNYAPSV